MAVSVAAAAAGTGPCSTALLGVTPTSAAEGAAAMAVPDERQGATLAADADDIMEGVGDSGASGQARKNK